jgi:hypothetical protein
MSSSDDANRSGGGWSVPPSAPTGTDEAAPAFAIPADERYADVELVASGGMGTVTIARDHRLAREVAIKRVAIETSDAAATTRLAREAEITARLEHPNIVAVYDAGIGADGGLFYAMRLIRGRSLAEALRDARPADHEMLRHFLDACHAMAYAHGRGIVHCDLKPSNIMVGEFGETQIVDWGLARDLAESAHAGTGAGTPAYLAPECVRGAPGDRTADVWALGAILHEIVTGRRLRDRDEGSVAAELRAVIDKAVAVDPTDRYPDAAALAADVAAFLDGGRVHAYAYNSFELARRFVRAYRIPLAVLAAATIAGLIVLGAMWRRVEGQRQRAVTAEHATRDALQATTSTLAWALDATATSALASGASAEAEVIAAHALRAGESIEARGVLAAVRAGARPGPVERIDIPGCTNVAAEDERHALCAGSDFIARWEIRDHVPREEWRVPIIAHGVIGGDGWIAGLEASAAVVMFEPTSGAVRARISFARPNAKLARDARGRTLVVHDDRSILGIDPESGTTYEIGRVCGDVTIDAVAVGRDEIFAICATGAVIRALRGRTASELTRVDLGPRLKPAHAAAVDPDGKRLAIGGLGGEVLIVSLSGGEPVAPRRVLDHAIARIAFLGDHVVIGGDRGAARVWTGGLATELLALPVHASADFVVRGESLISGGGAWWRWQPSVELAPRVFVSGAGLSGAAVRDDGEWVAAARGDGIVEAWSARDGRRSSLVTLASAVIKSVDFSADGQRLAAAIAQGGVSSAVVDTSTWQPATHEAATRGTARIAYLHADDLVGVHYGPDLSRWTSNGEHASIASPVFVDGARTADRRALWLLTADGAVWRLRDGELTFQFADRGARAIAAADADRGVLAMHPAGVTLQLASGSAIPVELPNTDAPTSIALSPDGAWAAIGTIGGVIYVWSTARRSFVAALRGHHERVAWVGFAAGALWSASWDGAIRRWSIDAFELSADALIADAERAWGMRLDVALRR